MKTVRRKGVAVIIATLIMLAAAALFTSIMLYWGLAFQGQSLSNFGGAIFRSNSAAAEQVSIDGILFTSVTTSPSATYSATVYVRNFGDNPVRLAGIHIMNLQSGSTPASLDCEVTITTPTVTHLPIVARAMKSVKLNTTTVSMSNPGCASPGGPITFPANWDGQSISVQVNTEAGTKFQSNYALPSALVSIKSVTFTASATTPSAQILLTSIGTGYLNLATVTITGSASNAGFKGSVTATIPSSGSVGIGATDGTWSAFPSSVTTFKAVATGTTVVITLSANTAGPNTGITSGDQITVSATTTEGTSVSIGFSVP